MSQSTSSATMTQPNSSTTIIEVLCTFWLFISDRCVKVVTPVVKVVSFTVNVLRSEAFRGFCFAAVIIIGNAGVAFVIIASDSSYTGPYAL